MYAPAYATQPTCHIIYNISYLHAVHADADVTHTPAHGTQPTRHIIYDISTQANTFLEFEISELKRIFLEFVRNKITRYDPTRRFYHAHNCRISHIHTVHADTDVTHTPARVAHTPVHVQRQERQQKTIQIHNKSLFLLFLSTRNKQ